jgi:hypothetical protein
MYKSLVLVTLFVGSLVCANNAEAAVSNMNIFKGLETLQNSPWDPREEQSPTDEPGKESIPDQAQAEE